MYICVTNNPDREIYSESYDKVFYLGFKPDKELSSNEVTIENNDHYEFNDYLISLKGVTNNGKIPLNKNNFTRFAKTNTNQILLNNSKSNIHDITDNGTYYFIGIKNHFEMEI